MKRNRLEINRYKAEVCPSLKKKLEAKQERLDESRDKILREANEQAYAILKEAKDVADTSIRNFNKYGTTHAPVSEMEKQRSKIRDKMSAAEKNMAGTKKKQAPAGIRAKEPAHR